MKLSINGIKEQEAWKKAGIALPGYDVETASEKAKENPVWVHFGIGNIFRVFTVELQMVFWKRKCWTVGLLCGNF